MTWDDATITQLRDLWAQGHSTAEIGRRLGVSKNACVGKAHRLGLDARPSPINRVPGAVITPRVGKHTLPPLASLALPLSASTGAVVAFRPSVPARDTPKPPVTPPRAPAAVALPRPRTLAQQEYHRGATMFRKRDPRAPAATYPTADEIARHIAQRGVTKCPTAAAYTTGTITAAETAAIAAHDEARIEAWRNGKGAGMLKAAMAGAAANRRRTRQDVAA